MSVRRAARHAAAILGVLTLGACAREAPPPAAPAPDTTEAEAEDEIEALWRARLDSARTGFTEADVRFMTDMLHHHAQALEMTRFAETNGASPEIRRLAARITNAQRDEIATMQRWLRDRGLPVPEIHPTGHHGGHGMPGMLTAAELRELGAARGEEFDRLFLEYMIRHHQGAVEMVHELFATDGAAQDEDVFRFASDVQVDQATEVARMKRMLEAMSAGGSR